MIDKILNLSGLILGILSFGYAIYQTKKFSSGIKTTSLIHIRSLINRLEEEKIQMGKNSAQWKTLHHTQQELEILFQSLQKTFGITEKSTSG